MQGGWYMQEVLNALTARPEVWSKTVLIVNFDENDGFFDHAPPPAPPSLTADGSSAGLSTCDVAAERSLHAAPLAAATAAAGRSRLRHGAAGADAGDFALESRRLGELRGFRPHLGDPLSSGASA